MRIGKLTALAVKNAHKSGMLGDGAGLYLQVADGGSKSWILRYKRNGKSHYLGLGPLHTISLAQARQRAAEARLFLLDGQDPIEARKASRATAAKAMTFGEAATQYIKAHRSGWRSIKHAGQWETTIATYAAPIIGDVPMQGITTEHVMRVLGDLWKARPETASRLRGRIESILDWGRVRGFRSGENPARWKGHLQALLPARAKVRRVEHLAALPHAQIAGFMTELRRQASTSARALEFAILTATRTGETLGARWDEIDLREKLWTIPAERTKALKEHRIPLSGPAIAILEEMGALRQNDYVFPGRRGSLSAVALEDVLKRMGRIDITVHGFRSCFRTWCAGETSFPSELAEQALGHTIGSRVERAYQRSDVLERRRALMAAWASYCARPSGERGVVVSIGAR